MVDRIEFSNLHALINPLDKVKELRREYPEKRKRSFRFHFENEDDTKQEDSHEEEVEGGGSKGKNVKQNSHEPGFVNNDNEETLPGAPRPIDIIV